jgi:hypothetical protein
MSDTNPTFSPALQSALDAFIAAQIDGTTPPEQIRVAYTESIRQMLEAGETETQIIAKLQSMSA